MAAASKGIQVGEKVIRVNWWVFKTEKLEHFDNEKKEEIQNTGISFALLYILRWCVFNIKIVSSICDLTYIYIVNKKKINELWFPKFCYLWDLNFKCTFAHPTFPCHTHRSVPDQKDISRINNYILWNSLQSWYCFFVSLGFFKNWVFFLLNDSNWAEYYLITWDGIYYLRLLCSDWKAMAMMRGINQASSHVFCLWCKCNKSNIKDFTGTFRNQFIHSKLIWFISIIVFVILSLAYPCLFLWVFLDQHKFLLQ